MSQLHIGTVDEFDTLECTVDPCPFKKTLSLPRSSHITCQTSVFHQSFVNHFEILQLP